MPHNDTLDLSSKELHDYNIFEVILLIQQHPTITKIDLSDNDISDTGVVYLASYLANKNNIVELDLAYNFIHDAGAIGLSKNKHFKSLDLSGNEISNKGALAFISTTLISLNLYHNPITKSCIEELKQHPTSLSLGFFEDNPVRKAYKRPRPA